MSASSSENAAAGVGNQDGEFSSRVPRDGPLTTKGVRTMTVQSLEI